MIPLEIAGYWFLPETPEAKVPGVLKYSREEGFRLHIPLGHLGDAEQFFERFAQPNVECIRGDLQNGKKITLANCILMRATVNMPGINSEEYYAPLGFYGECYTDPNPLIKSVRLTYPNLRDWVLHNPVSRWPVSEGKSLKALVYRYEVPDANTLGVGEGWRLTLEHMHIEEGPTVKGFSLTHDTYLMLELDEPMAFSEVDNHYLHMIQCFLSFCMNKALHESSMKVLLPDDEKWLDVGGHMFTSSTLEGSIHKHSMLLPLPKIADRIDTMLNRWMGLRGDSRRSVALLVGLLRERQMPLDLQFLLAVQALEALARVDVDLDELEPEEFQRRLSIVSKSIEDSKVRAWALRKLKHSNYREFAQLLDKLVKEIGEYVAVLAPDTKRFLNDIRVNRNNYTHRKEEDELVQGQKLLVLTEGVTCLLRAAILRKLLKFTHKETCDIMLSCIDTRRSTERVAEQYSISQQ